MICHQRKIPGLVLLVLVSCWAGCNSPTGGSEAAGVARRTALKDLPPAYRELVLAWRRQDPDWPLRREMALEDPGLTRFLVENLMVELIAAWQAGDFSQEGSSTRGRYDLVRGELWRIGDPAAKPLSELLALGNGQGPAIAGDVLMGLGIAGVRATSDQLLREENTNARGRAAELLGRLPRAPDAEPLVQTRLLDLLRTDPEWIVRRHCALALALRIRGFRAREEGTPDRALGALSRALVDTDPAVSKAAAVGLGIVGDVRAVPALINHLERILRSSDLNHARSVYRSLSALTGVRDLRGTAAWRDWWRLHGKARIDVQAVVPQKSQAKANLVLDPKATWK